MYYSQSKKAAPTAADIEEHIRQKMQESYEQEERDMKRYQIVRQLIADKWIGKQVNARIKKQLEEITGDQVSYGEQYGQMKVWIGPYEERAGIYLTKTIQSGAATLEILDEENSMYTEAAIVRQAKREVALQDGRQIRRAAELAHEIREAWNVFDNMDHDSSGKYFAKDFTTVKDARG
jgi:hypothetical protein